MTVPLNAQQAVVLMAVPYVTDTAEVRLAVNAKIKMGVVDLVARTVIETVVLEDSVTPSGGTVSDWAGAEAAVDTITSMFGKAASISFSACSAW